MAARPGKTGVVLIQKFLVAGIRVHALEDHTILLKDIPVQGFQFVPVHELPGIALPAADLAGPPEKHPTVFRVDRRHESDDAKIAARACFLPIGQRRDAEPE